MTAQQLGNASKTSFMPRCHEPCPTALCGDLKGLECTVEIGSHGHRGQHRTTHKVPPIGKVVFTWSQHLR